MHIRLWLAVLVTGVLVGQSNPSTLRYQDLSASFEERAADLVSRMSLEEKVGQMQDNAPAIPRLGIPTYNWWNEALHGVARAGLATVFPQAIGLAATWDTALEQRITGIISTEARAKYNDAIAHDNHRRYFGLTFWSPNINIFRDPRWGRGQETYGEDPYLTAQMALAFIHGMQGDDGRYFKTIATSKHFAVHSGPESSRHQFNVNPTPHDLDSTYLEAFKTTLAPGGAYSVMCAYNSVDGAPACANAPLLDDHLRREWQFKGYVVSDCGAVGDIFTGHHYADSMPEAAAKAVKAGTDLDCGTEYKTLTEAVAKGMIAETEITRSVERLFVARFRLGLFDPPERVSFSRIGMDQVASASHQQVALEAAEKSIVLLKNSNALLPLERIPQRIAVIGPAADDPDTLLGNYNGTPNHIVTPLAGIQRKFGQQSQIGFALGSVYARSSVSLIPESALTPPNGAQHGLLAEYFANGSFEGQPVLSRVEPRGYLNWDMHDPVILKSVPSPSFSVRWTANLQVKVSGDYEIGIARQECDSCPGTISARLAIRDRTLAEETGRAAGGASSKTSPIHLVAGTAYPIKFEFSQNNARAGFELVWVPPADASLAEAVELAKNSDLSVLCLGLNSRLEGEESKIEVPGFDRGDRTDIRFPEPQEKLLKAVLDAGKPVIVVLLNGSAVAIQQAKDRAQAILEAWYPGQDGGIAIANTLSGDNNPAGRLPVTFYQNVNQLPPFDDYSMKDRTYRYFSGQPLYPFGYGLSYSDFRYSDFQSKPAQDSGQEISSRVTNRSARDGDEVVQLYVKAAGSNVELKGFRRIHLRAGESQVSSFLLPHESIESATSISIGGGQPLESWTGGHFIQRATRP